MIFVQDVPVVLVHQTVRSTSSRSHRLPRYRLDPYDGSSICFTSFCEQVQVQRQSRCLGFRSNPYVAVSTQQRKLPRGWKVTLDPMIIGVRWLTEEAQVTANEKLSVVMA